MVDTSVSVYVFVYRLQFSTSICRRWWTVYLRRFSVLTTLHTHYNNNLTSCSLKVPSRPHFSSFCI